MCGIAGFIDPSRQTSEPELRHKALRMADAIAHRGPDDRAAWVDPRVGLALSFRRLAILDLSETGRQPMVSADGRYISIFNGEVYNYSEIRQQLEPLGHRFRGSSDTEVMLAAICQWGLTEAVTRFNGMFALALWDQHERCLYLVRDRLGIKPLYYGWLGGVFVFASELRGLLSFPSTQANIDRNALALLLQYSYIPAPHSIYEGIQKLLPGTILKLESTGTSISSQEVSFWSAQEVVEGCISDPFSGSETEAVAELDALLKDAVGLRMIADVPLGAFLSGGIDSSTVVSLMQAQSMKPVKTFSIGFHESEYDEAVYARQVSNHLGTDHTELYLTPQDTLDVIPQLPHIYDEPFADPSQIPTYIVSQLARQHVTVSLSGDGGDELFGGYNRHFWGSTLWHTTRRLPVALRRMGASAITSIPPGVWKRAYSAFKRIIPSGLRVQNPGEKAHKLAEILALESPDAVYRRLASHWELPGRFVLGVDRPSLPLASDNVWEYMPDLSHSMMYLDLITYLPNDILAKLDRASMAVSLEARVPLLDHRLVEFAWRLPLRMKIRGNSGKWLLRQVLHRYIPDAIMERPKMGFGVPIDDWLRGPLRDWAEALLHDDRLRREAFFDPEPIREKWQEHLSGKRNWQYRLWNVLMFQAWLENNSGLLR